MLHPVCIDFETEAIDDARPHVPPKPVGVAIREPGKRARYLAWGHPSENDCTRDEARAILRDLWKGARPLLFHNAAFDLAVAEHHIALRWPHGERVEDTMVLLWLADPYVPLGLKDAAATLCDLPPDERDELRAWILANAPGAKPKGWGTHIAKAPGKLVGRYACGDVDRTLALWRVLSPVREKMAWRYRREMKVLRIAWRMTQRGIPLDVSGLEVLDANGTQMIASMERRLRKMLGANIDMGKRDDVADALERKGWVREWSYTDKAKRRSTNVHDLARGLVPRARGFAHIGKDGRPAGLWADYQLLSHTLSTFARPWLARAEKGRLHARWNTVVSYEEGHRRGAKTGRFSSNPNVQNISKSAPDPSLPYIRDFIVAPKHRRLVCGDISQQEPRLTAHFAGGTTAQAYRDNPSLDDHTFTAELMGVTRGRGKTLNLACTYALGIAELARRLGVSDPEAASFREQWRRARPDVATLDTDLRRHWAQGGAIETWGGALVYVEPGTEERTWEYRALNTLIQRSAAEQLKEVLIAWEAAKEEPLVLTAHDETLAEAQDKDAERVQGKMREVLEATRAADGTRPFNVPFIAEVGIGRTWREAKK